MKLIAKMTEQTVYDIQFTRRELEALVDTLGKTPSCDNSDIGQPMYSWLSAVLDGRVGVLSERDTG